MEKLNDIEKELNEIATGLNPKAFNSFEELKNEINFTNYSNCNDKIENSLSKEELKNYLIKKIMVYANINFEKKDKKIIIKNNKIIVKKNNTKTNKIEYIKHKKINQRYIESFIKRVEYIEAGEKTIICLIIDKNGNEIISSFQDTDNFYIYDNRKETSYNLAIKTFKKIIIYLLQNNKMIGENF